jgi:hypothetical protein
VNVGELHCIVDGKAAEARNCYTDRYSQYLEFLTLTANAIAASGKAIPPPPTPDPATQHDRFPVSGAHKTVTIRTSAASAYWIEVPGETAISIGDSWPAP